MCGIIGFTGDTPAAPVLLEGLRALEYRGYDSAGIALLCKHKFTVKKTTERIGELASQTKNGSAVGGNLGIGHTRWATHGGATPENAHPHLSSDGRFAVVHNGIIENYFELASELAEDGVTLKSETDSEVIPNLIAKYYKGDLLSALITALKRLQGSFALGIICTDYPDTLIGVRQFSPLLVGLSREKKLIASDINALTPYTEKTVTLEDGEIAFLTPNMASFYDFSGNPVKKKPQRANKGESGADKGEFEHFMLKEIMEQPRAVKETVIHRIKEGKVCFDGLKLDKNKLKSINRINIIACGSAYHAGVVAKYFFESLLGIPTEAEVASEFRYRHKTIDERTLTLVISQSGETADTLAGLFEAKERGSYTLAVVNVVSSSIARAAHDVLYTHAGPEIAVATTKGYTTQLALLYLFGVWVAQQLKTAPETELTEILNGLLSAEGVLEECLKVKEKIADMAKRSCYINSIFFIGRNLDYAVSMEASLKLKEISYIHSEAYPAGELKHGTISLIEHGTTVMALSCFGELGAKMVSNIREVKARGAFVVVCAAKDDARFSDVADELILIPQIYPLLAPIAEIIPFQLYAYYVAVYKDCDVDKPRNLAKSVTVE